METTPSSNASGSPMDVSGNSPDGNATRNAVFPEIERWQDLFRGANTDRMSEQRWHEDSSLLFRKLGEPTKSMKSSTSDSKDARDPISAMKEDFISFLDHEEFIKRMEAEVLATDWMFPSPTSTTTQNK